MYDLSNISQSFTDNICVWLLKKYESGYECAGDKLIIT